MSATYAVTAIELTECRPICPKIVHACFCCDEALVSVRQKIEYFQRRDEHYRQHRHFQEKTSAEVEGHGPIFRRGLGYPDIGTGLAVKKAAIRLLSGRGARGGLWGLHRDNGGFARLARNLQMERRLLGRKVSKMRGLEVKCCSVTGNTSHA